MGPKVAEFEALLAARRGHEHAVAVSSGTAALHVAVLALGLGPGDEVLVPAYTFPATANVVALVGATPGARRRRPGDDEHRPADAARRVTPRTKAVLAVHLFGRPARLEELPDAAGRSRTRRARSARAAAAAPCGSLGVARLLLVPPAQDRHDGRGRRGHDGRRRARGRVALAPPPRLAPSGAYADMPAPGFNYRLSRRALRARDPAAAPARRAATPRTSASRPATPSGCADRPSTLPSTDAGDCHGWQAYVVQVDRRDEVMAGLRAQGIQCQIGTYALHRLGAYRDQGAVPRRRAAFERALALPLHTRLDRGRARPGRGGA